MRIFKTALMLLLVLFLVPQLYAQDEKQELKEQMKQLKSQMKELSTILDSLEDIDIEIDDPEDKKNTWKFDFSNYRDPKLTRSHFVFAIGPTFVIDDEISTAANPDPSPFRSWSGILGAEWQTRFGHQSNFGIEYGIVYRWTEIDNRNNYIYSEIDAENETFAYIQNGQDYKQSELYGNYLAIPIALRINDKENERFAISIGGFAGIRIGGKQELKYEEDGKNRVSKTRNSLGLSDFNYGLTLGIGSPDWQWFTSYELNNFFESEETYKWNALMTGFKFIL